MIILYRLYNAVRRWCIFIILFVCTNCGWVTTSYNQTKTKTKKKNYRNWVCECVCFVISHVFGSDFLIMIKASVNAWVAWRTYSNCCARGTGATRWHGANRLVAFFSPPYLRWNINHELIFDEKLLEYYTYIYCSMWMARAYNYVGKHFVKTQNVYEYIVHHFSNTHIKLYYEYIALCVLCVVC